MLPAENHRDLSLRCGKLLVMSAHSVAPGAQQKRFAAYLNRLAQAAGHRDRVVPLKSYCTGLLLPGERKSVEPMAARLCPDNVRQTHQSLHHVVAHAPWSDEDILATLGLGLVARGLAARIR